MSDSSETDTFKVKDKIHGQHRSMWPQLVILTIGLAVMVSLTVKRGLIRPFCSARTAAGVGGVLLLATTLTIRAVFFSDLLLIPNLIVQLPTAPAEAAIFGMYDGLPPQKLERFLRSLRKSGSTADVYIAFQPEYLDTYLPVLEQFRATAMMFERGIVSEAGWFALSSLRFRIYRRCLEQLHAADIFYDYVMTVDVTDVSFQADPFAIVTAPPPRHSAAAANSQDWIMAVYENQKTTIDISEYTGKWIQSCFGDEILVQLHGLRVSCSGSTIGTGLAMRSYIKLMDDIGSRHRGCSKPGVDQGVHNYILHSAHVLGEPLLPAIHPVSLESGPILTLDRVTTLRFDEETGLVLNERNRPYHVLHQLKRCPQDPATAWFVASETSQADRQCTIARGQADEGRNGTSGVQVDCSMGSWSDWSSVEEPSVEVDTDVAPSVWGCAHVRGEASTT